MLTATPRRLAAAAAPFVSVDFEIANGKVSKVSNVSVTGGQSGNLPADTDETTVTIAPSSVRAEGTARGVVDGKQREDIPFTIDIACDSLGWPHRRGRPGASGRLITAAPGPGGRPGEGCCPAS